MQRLSPDSGDLNTNFNISLSGKINSRFRANWFTNKLPESSLDKVGLEVRTVCTVQGSKSKRMALGINKNKLRERERFFIKLKSIYLEWKVSNLRCAFKNMTGLKNIKGSKRKATPTSILCSLSLQTRLLPSNPYTSAAVLCLEITDQSPSLLSFLPHTALWTEDFQPKIWNTLECVKLFQNKLWNSQKNQCNKRLLQRTLQLEGVRKPKTLEMMLQFPRGCKSQLGRSQRDTHVTYSSPPTLPRPTQWQPCRPLNLWEEIPLHGHQR